MNTSSESDFASLPHPAQGRIDDLCDEFESELVAGRPTSIARYLPEVDQASRETLFQELLAVELHHRGSDAGPISPASYQTQFPNYLDAIQRAFAGIQSPFAPGMQVGDFLIEQQLGAGGMGIVFQARDTKLDRNVALKVLPNALADDPQRLARFEREAKLLAALNHPNIATLYGFEQCDGVRFCILELVPGKTLAQMLRRRPLTLEKTIGTFIQLASALEAAHERGIVHRDLKPANVMVTSEGKVKVLDFGLATSPKVLSGETDRTSLGDSTDLRTNAGAILGTVAYMSPEQTRGKAVDKRADIWAFGCCLYEALVGQKAFAGETVSDTIAAILEHDPDWSLVPESIPANIGILLRRCLQKDAARRLHDIADGRIELEDTSAPPSSVSAVVGLAETQRKLLSGPLRRVVPWGIAGLMTIITMMVLWNKESPTQKRMARFPVKLTEPDSLALAPAAPLVVGRPSLTLAPDGTSLVYVVERSGVARLYMKRLGEFEASPIPGTEGAYGPFFSPDSKWIGFFDRDGLKKVSVLGGLPEHLCEAPNTYGGTWGPDGTIYFSPHFGTRLQRISAAGSTGAEGISSTIGQPSVTQYSWPAMLPSGEAVLLTTGARRTTHAVDVVLLRTGERRTLISGGTNARYAPTGHLVYAREGTLHAVPFDAQQLKKTGPSVPVLNGVRTEAWGAAQFDVSHEGTLAYVPGGAMDEGTLVWKDRERDSEPVEAWPGECAYGSFRLSPDSRRLVVQIPGANEYISIFDFDRPSVPTRLTRTDAPAAELPIWSPDGQWVVFSSLQEGKYSLIRRRADGTGNVEHLLSSPYWVRAASWSPNGQYLSFIESHPVSSFDIYLLRLDNDRERQEFRVTPAGEFDAEFSPDGEWIAYTSNESGQAEVYVRHVSGTGRAYPISQNGGEEPIWSKLSDELFYRVDDKWMAVSVTTQSTSVTAEGPIELFQGPYLPIPGPSYDYDAKGDRFLLVRGNESKATEIRVVLNWFEELKRLSPQRKD